MRKIGFCLFVSLFACVFSQAQYVNIADSNFRALLIKVYPSCFNGSGQMDTTCRSITAEDSLYVNQDSIQDLSGVQYFKGLKLLDCENNLLKVLPTLPAKLKYLYCSNNQLTSLPVLPSQLLSLNCENNQLTALPSLPDSLTSILCAENKLQSLPTLPDSLKTLVCAFNQLTTLPALPAKLTLLDCGNNQLTKLPLLPDSLQNLYCYTNQLTALPALAKNVYLLDCDSNRLTSLPDILPNALNYLDVSTNPVSSIPILDSLHQLQYLYCEGDSNLLCLPRLPNSLDSLNVSGTGVRCIPNNAGNDKVFPTDLPICNITNNANQCITFPVIKGKVFYDKNSNGIKDKDEYYIPYVPVTLNDGKTELTNFAGQYSITTADTGSFSLSALASPLFKVVPSVVNFRFSSYEEQLTLADIAIQPNEVKDSLAIHIYPWQNAIPGRELAYSIAYRNLGTSSSYDTIRFTYDTSNLVFKSASIPLIASEGNTIVWLDTLSAQSFGNKHYRSGYKYPILVFSVKQTVDRGTTLASFATINNTSTSDSIIVKSSYDPNNKQATPQLTTKQVINGEVIDYLIHFQNVGNASAENIVIADTLNMLLNKNLFQMIGSSHSPNIEIDNKNGVVYFQFLNINLEDSSSNQVKSNGFVHFRLTPQKGDTTGCTIYNNASVYFDYNKPVLTNTASTIIVNPPLPVSISNYQLEEFGGINVKVKNEWKTANELNIAHFDVQRSFDGVIFSTIGKVTARGNGAYNYQFIDNSPLVGISYYRLKTVDKNGSISYSKVVAIQVSAIINQVFIYPNPAKDFILINGKNIEQISIIDNAGRIILSKKVLGNATQNKLEFKLSGGTYLARLLMTDGKIITKKVIVE